MPDEAKVKSLFKAIKILDYFTPDHPERGITELAKMSGLLKSSLHNIVSTFVSGGFLEKSAETGRYRLGLKILELSNNLYLSHDLRILVRPFLEKLCQATGENVYFGTVAENEVIYMDAVMPQATFTGRSIIGIKAPLYCTGIGKALLAFQGPDQVAAVVGQGLKAFTDHTLADPQALEAELALTRARGYAIDNMEHEFGIYCVAVPILNIRGSVVAAMSVSGPQPRFTEEKIRHHLGLLLDSAAQLRNLIRR
jgi:DNA-binding IclR family transcriptional regulator